MSDNYFDSITKAMEDGNRIEKSITSGKEGAGSAIKQLIQAFSNESWVVRKKASSALSKFGNAAVDELALSIESSNPDIRYWSIKTLGRIGMPAYDTLLKALKSKDSEMAMLSAEAFSAVEDDSVIKPLIDILSTAPWTVCNTVSTALVKRGTSVVKYLGEALKSNDENKMCWATVILGRMGENAILPLIKFLKSKNRTMRFYAARALGESGDERAIKPLIEALTDPYWTVRKNAAESLGKIGGKAIDFLAASLRDKRDEVRNMATQILSDIGPSALTVLLGLLEDEQHNMYFIVEDIVMKIGDDAIPKLIDLLTYKQQSVRVAAAQMLGKFSNVVSAKPLVNALGDSSWNVRKAAAGALKRIGNPALSYLKSAINHPSENVRFWTTRVLASMGNEALSPLIDSLNDPNQDIRIFAATALGETEDKRAVYPLIKALKDRVWLVRKSAADSLMKIGLMHIEVLVKSLNDPNPDIRYWIERIIGEIGDKAIKPLVDVLKNDRNREMRFFAAFGLSAIGDKSAVPALIEALESDVNDWVRKYSAEALGRINDPKGVKALVDALGKQRGDICEWIVDVLSKSETPPVDLISKKMREGSDKSVIYCINCLGKIGTQQVLPHLVLKLNTEDEDVVNATTQAFLKTGKIAIPALVKALEDENWAVRKNSADILSMLGDSAEEALNDALVKEDKNLRYWATSALRKMKKSKNNM